MKFLRLGAVFGFAAIPIYPSFFAFAAVGAPSVELVPRWLSLVTILTAAALALVAAGVSLARRDRPGPLLVPGLVLVGAYALAAVAGFDPVAGLLVTLAMAMSVVLAQVTWSVRSDAATVRAILAVVLFGVVASSLVALIALAQRRPAALYVLAHGRAAGTFLVPGELGGYLVLAAATAAGVFAGTRSTLLRWLAAAALACAAPALALTFARAAWLGVAAALAFAAAVRLRSPAARAGLGAVVAALALALVTVHARHNPDDNFTRLGIWLGALRSVALFPATGAGPGAFHLVYPLVRPADADPVAFHAHDYPLTVLVDAGLAGGLAAVAYWAAVVGRTRAALRGASAQSRTFALAVAAGLAGTLAQGTLDYVQVLAYTCWFSFPALALALADAGAAPW